MQGEWESPGKIKEQRSAPRPEPLSSYCWSPFGWARLQKTLRPSQIRAVPIACQCARDPAAAPCP